MPTRPTLDSPASMPSFRTPVHDGELTKSGIHGAGFGRTCIIPGTPEKDGEKRPEPAGSGASTYTTRV
jgi:hypothetical protein